MAIENENEGPGGRALVLIALLALVTTGTVAFARVFREDGTTLHLVLAGAASLLLATLFERRHVLLAAGASMVGLALTITWLAYPNSAWYGLPTASTWSAAVRSLSAVSRTAEVHVAPAPTLIPLLLAALAAIWAASFATHALAVRARSPFLAILPTASLLAFAGIVMRDKSRPIYVLPFLAACLLVLFADALHRVGQWGPLTIWSQAGIRSTWHTASWTKSARRVAMTCLGVALFAPWILPGFGARSVLDVREAVGGAAVSIDPIVDLKPQLLEQSGRELFTVRSRESSYWRMIALDRFDGDQWRSSDPLAEDGIQTSGGDLQVDGFEPALASEAVPQRVRFEAGVQSWLPAAYPAVSIDVEDETLRQDPATGNIVLPDGTYDGFTYLATSLRVVPTDDQLDAIPSLAGNYPITLTLLPADTPPDIFRLAREFAAEAGAGASPYLQLLAIQRHLQGFTYSVDVPAGHGVNDILYFLERSQQGYCEQFAGTMAVLARALGFPARVAVGFTPGTQDEDDRRLYHVTGLNAHAWVEVLFPRWGWLAFEPTPTRVNPVAQPYLNPRSDTGTGGLPRTTSLLEGKRAQLERQEAGFRRGCDSGGLCSNPLPLRDPTSGPAAQPEGPSRMKLAVVVIAVLLLVLIVAIPLWKAVRRRLALRPARDARQRVIAAYTVFTDTAADVGLGRRGGETLGEYRRRLEREVRFSDGHLGRLTGLAGVAAYSDRELGPEQADEAVACARQAGADVRRSSGRAKAALGWFRVDRPFSRNGA